MEQLINENGDMLTYNYSIMNKLHRSYDALFRSEERTFKVDDAMNDMMKYTSDRIDETTKGKIEEMPTMEEITSTLKKLPKKCLPRNRWAY